MKAKDKLPYYSWYASDFLGSPFVQSLSLIEECCYRRLLDIQAISTDNRISEDPNILRAQCKNIPMPQWRKIWDRIKGKFVQHPDGNLGLVNLKLHNILLERRAFLQERADSGRKGANSKWNKETGDSLANSSASGTVNGSAYSRPHGKSMASISTSISIPIPPLKNPQSLINPSVPIQPPDERTDGVSKTDFQKFWGPVEKVLRGRFASFPEKFWGTQILDMNARQVELAVPRYFLDQCDGVENAVIALKNLLNEIDQNFLRGRGLKLVSLESVPEERVGITVKPDVDKLVHADRG